MQRFTRLPLSGAAVALALVAAGIGAAAATASRTTRHPGAAGSDAGRSAGATSFYVFRNRATRSCLADVTGAGVTQSTCPANPDKASIPLRWQLQYSGGYLLRSVATQQCLVGSSIPIGRGDRVATLPCTGDGHKFWVSSSATFQAGEVLQNPAYRQPMCLDDTGRYGVTVQLCTPNEANNYEAWYAILAAS